MTTEQRREDVLRMALRGETQHFMAYSLRVSSATVNRDIQELLTIGKLNKLDSIYTKGDM